VSGDINFTGNLKQNGTIFQSSSSQWTTTGTMIYYNTSNVGIGTTNPSTILDIMSAIPTMTLRTSAGASGQINFGNGAHGIGRGVNISTLTSSNDVLLFTAGSDGNIGLCTSGTERFRITPSGNVGIGSTNPQNKLDVTGNVFVTGSILATGNITASYSDIRLKEIVNYIENPLEKLMKINTFKYKPSALAYSLNIQGNVQVGVSAQDVKEVLPEVVSLAPFDTCNLPSGEVISKSGSEYLTVSYERLVPLLIECIKELNLKVDILTQKLK
jgi:hypothetical protein